MTHDFDRRRKISPRCAICADAHGTRYVCSTCRADPANDRWQEGRELLLRAELDLDAVVKCVPWDEGEPDRSLPPRLAAAVRAIATSPRATLADIARVAKCSLSYAHRAARLVEEVRVRR